MTTGIEWTDETWNPVTGCTKVSEGCEHCYIETTPPFRMQGRRFDLPTIGGTTGVQLHPERLEHPLHWRRPRRVFVNSLSDLFHDDVGLGFLAEVFAVMALACAHVFQVLTKRPRRMQALLTRGDFQTSIWLAAERRAGGMPDLAWPLPNVWLGVSVESQKWADQRIPLLLETPAAIRFLSCEPLLGPVDLYDSAVAPLQRFPDEPNDQAGRIDWVIAGGESGPGARPMHPDWVRGLRDQCVAAGVPFFYKQTGAWAVVEEPYRQTDTLLRADGYTWPLDQPHGAEDGTEVVVRNVGKKKAGRELDGRTWNDYPEEVPSL